MVRIFPAPLYIQFKGKSNVFKNSVDVLENLNFGCAVERHYCDKRNGSATHSCKTNKILVVSQENFGKP